MKAFLVILVLCAVALALVPSSEACGPALLCAPPPKKVVVAAQTNVVVVQQPVIYPAYFFAYNPTVFSPSVQFQMSAQYERQYTMPGPAMPSVDAQAMADYQMYLRLKARFGAMPCQPGCTPEIKGSGSGSGEGSGSGVDVLPGDDEDKVIYAGVKAMGCLSCHSGTSKGGPAAGFQMDLADGSLPHFSPPEKRALKERTALPLDDPKHMPKADAPQPRPEVLSKWTSALEGNLQKKLLPEGKP
jgi:hypothetical protein